MGLPPRGFACSGAAPERKGEIESGNVKELAKLIPE